MVAAQDIEATVIGQARTRDTRPMVLRPRSMTAIIPTSKHEGHVDGHIDLALTDDVVCDLVILAACCAE